MHLAICTCTANKYSVIGTISVILIFFYSLIYNNNIYGMYEYWFFVRIVECTGIIDSLKLSFVRTDWNFWGKFNKYLFVVFQYSRWALVKWTVFLAFYMITVPLTEFRRKKTSIVPDVLHGYKTKIKHLDFNNSILVFCCI